MSAEEQQKAIDQFVADWMSEEMLSSPSASRIERAMRGDLAKIADAASESLREQVRHLEHNLANIIRTG